MASPNVEGKIGTNHPGVVLKNFETAGRFSRKTWSLLSLEIWHQTFHDRASEFREKLDNETSRF